MWRRSGGNILRTLRLASGISILSFGMIPETLPELLKIGKTGQRARHISTGISRQTSTTQEYPSLIDTFYVAHTVNGKLLRDEDRRIYFESGGASGSGGCGDEEEGADHQDDEDEDGNVLNVVGIEHARVLNKNKETPWMVFKKEHKELRKDAEEWMKKTADSYTITIIVFAAAITVPGGTDDMTGKPIYEMKPSFIIFSVADAISLFTATTSLLSFLYIHSARYKDGDFLYNLPKKLIYGLVMLSVSVISMMIAFGATLYLMFGQGKHWTWIPIGALASLLIASFTTLLFLLLQVLIYLTYGPGIFPKEKEYWQSSAVTPHFLIAQ
nr:ankyrin repeat family protein [Tanacetum cinerariifolium]